MTKRELVPRVPDYGETKVTEYRGFVKHVHDLLTEDDFCDIRFGGFCRCEHCLHIFVLHLIKKGKLRASPRLLKSVKDAARKRELIEAICLRAAMEG